MSLATSAIPPTDSSGKARGDRKYTSRLSNAGWAGLSQRPVRTFAYRSLCLLCAGDTPLMRLLNDFCASGDQNQTFDVKTSMAHASFGQKSHKLCEASLRFMNQGKNAQYPSMKMWVFVDRKICIKLNVMPRIPAKVL